MKAWLNALAQATAVFFAVTVVSVCAALITVKLDAEAQRQLEAGAVVEIPIDREFEV